MDVELLVVPDCPHENAAAQLLHTALVDVGLPNTRFRTTVMTPCSVPAAPAAAAAPPSTPPPTGH